MAEASVITKVEDIIKCAICLKILNDPKTFNCLHSFCAKCIEGLTQTTKDDDDTIKGYACPECRRFTPIDDVRVVHLVIQLLDAYYASKRLPGETKCDVCNTADAKWSCMGCSEGGSLCDAYKMYHDKFVKHQVLSLEQLKDESHVLEKPMFCSEHKENKIEVFCTRCEKTMCVLCKIFNHDGHPSEPIADALRRLMQKVDEKRERIEAKIEENTEAIEALKAEKAGAIKAFDNTLQVIGDHITEQKQVVMWVKTMATRIKGVTLLQELQDGLLKKVDQLALESGYGKSRSGFKIHASRCWPWGPVDSNRALTLKQTIQLPDNYCTRIAILWDKLWIPNHSSCAIYVYSFDGTRVNVLQYVVSKPRTAVQISPKEAVVVGQNQLVIVNESGQSQVSLHNHNAYDHFFDACLPSDGILYVFGIKSYNNEFNNQARVMRFSNSGTTWQKKDEIVLQNSVQPIQYYNRNHHNDKCWYTMVVKDIDIYVSWILFNRIIRYDLAGNMLKDVGTQNSALNQPSICGMTGHTLLIANCNNNRLDQLDYSGKTTQIAGFASRNPWHAIYQNERTLWVLTNNGQLLKYE